MARGLGCYPRLGCGLRARRLECYSKHISCPGWCLHSCRWLGSYLCTLYCCFLGIYPIFFLVTPVLCFNYMWMAGIRLGKGSVLVCISCLLCSSLACGETLTASLLARSLIAGRVVLRCLFCSDTAELSHSEKETGISIIVCFGFIYLVLLMSRCSQIV